MQLEQGGLGVVTVDTQGHLQFLKQDDEDLYAFSLENKNVITIQITMEINSSGKAEKSSPDVVPSLRMISRNRVIFSN